MIDGFPREVNQAKYFEQHVLPAQTVLYFNVTNEICLERCLGRVAAGSTRDDDKADILLKRLDAFRSQTEPVIDLYRKFGKVREIDGKYDPLNVYENTRKVMLPQVSFLIGPQASGKSTVARAVCEKSNQKHINFNEFVASNRLTGKDDETIVMALIKSLSSETSPNVLIEDFPKTEFQAKFFIKNGVVPTYVFVLKCSKDSCQERMSQIDTDGKDYQASAVLAKKIRQYNDDA